MAQTLGNDRWFALYVRVNHEKLISSALRTKGLEEFLPLCQMRRRWSDRTKQIQSPLFPGYVFCRFDLEYRLPILTIPGVRMIVGIGKTPLPIEDSEIAAIQSIVHSGLSAEPWPFLQIGQRVRITHGSLEGLEGILLAEKKPFRLIVSVTLLQRSVAVEIDQGWATPISPSRKVPYSRQSPLTPIP